MQEWQQFLQSKHHNPNTIIQEGKVVQISEPTIEQQTLNTDLCDLSHLGLLEISGADRLTFYKANSLMTFIF
jgi:hypothetical protein